MYSQKDKDRFKELNGISIEDFVAGHNDTAEKPLALPEGQILTDAQLTQRDEVKVKEGEKTGEKKAIEIAKKEITKHSGIEVKGERWAEIGTEIKTAINSTGDEKVKTLQDQNALLLKDKTDLETKAAQAESALQTGMFEIGILSKLPAHVAGLSPKETFELAKMRGYTPEKTDTGVVWKKNGEPLKDPVTHAPLAEDKAIAHIWETEKWNPAAQAGATGGRGAQQRSTGAAAGAIKSRSEAEAAWKELHPDKNMQTPEGMAYYNELAKQPDFNMYE